MSNSFPVDTVDGERVEIVDKAIDEQGKVELTADDGRVFTPSANALKVELKEAGEAVGHLADEASEAVDEVVEDVEDAAKAVAEDVADLVDAAEVAGTEIGDVLEAAGDVAQAIADDPVGTLKDLLDDEEEAPAPEPAPSDGEEA